jgi:acetyl-CoA carboxylase biotin carboxylase subunit
MSTALEEFTVEGVHTTIPFHRRVMRIEAFQKGEFDTGFIDTHYNHD